MLIQTARCTEPHGRCHVQCGSTPFIDRRIHIFVIWARFVRQSSCRFLSLCLVEFMACWPCVSGFSAVLAFVRGFTPPTGCGLTLLHSCTWPPELALARVQCTLVRDDTDERREPCVPTQQLFPGWLSLLVLDGQDFFPITLQCSHLNPS